MKNPPSENPDNILVTICVTSYNRAEGLAKVLNCITQQTHEKLQIIISDDCSPDKNVSNVIASYAERDPRIKYYIQKENIGYFKNLKTLLEKSVGDFVMWCDDDDWYDRTYVQKCLAELLKNKMSSTAFPYYFEADESGEKNTSYPNQVKLLERLNHKNTYLRLLAYLFTYDGYGYCNVYYGLHRRAALSWFNPENFGLAIDMDFGMKLISLSPVALVRETLYKKTVGNEKKYLTLQKSKTFKLMGLYTKTTLLLKDNISRVIGYCRLLRPHQSLFILIFSPIWLASLIFNSANKYVTRSQA